MVFIQEREEPVVDFNVRRGDAKILHETSASTGLKWGPGQPRMKPRQEDWNQQWIDTVESEYCSLVRAWDSYEVAYVTYYADKA